MGYGCSQIILKSSLKENISKSSLEFSQKTLANFLSFINLVLFFLRYFFNKFKQLIIKNNRSLNIPRPSENDYAPFYAGYLKNIEGDDILTILRDQLDTTTEFFKSISEEKGDYSYSEGKWTIKEILGHITDTERVFAYRAMCIARGERKSLPGFEQDDYVREGNFNKRTLTDLIEEYAQLRKANLVLFNSFSEEALNIRGLANNYEITVRAILFIIAGHGLHHINVLKEKYLKSF